ncbi:MAG: hypothetical protein AAF658_03565 [Myxococcota bacterium]
MSETPPTVNPYAAPTSDLSSATSAEEANSYARAVSIRKEHLSHEANLRAAGLLNYLSGGALGFISLFGLATLSGEATDTLLTFVLLGALSVLLLASAYMLRALRGQARVVSTLAWLPGLAGFPVGTLISLFVLYLLHSRKGRFVLSGEYRAIRDQTPEIESRSLLGIILLVLLLIGLAGFIAAFVLGAAV